LLSCWNFCRFAARGWPSVVFLRGPVILAARSFAYRFPDPSLALAFFRVWPSIPTIIFCSVSTSSASLAVLLVPYPYPSSLSIFSRIAFLALHHISLLELCVFVAALLRF
jgi:hypothetical protein